MITKHICTECSSPDVEIRGWINLNTGKTNTSGAELITDYWCNTCEAHTEVVYNRTFFEVGESVLWKDPEGKTSGIYIVMKKISEEDRQSVYLIANDFSEAEVFEHELTSTQTSIFQ